MRRGAVAWQRTLSRAAMIGLLGLLVPAGASHVVRRSLATTPAAKRVGTAPFVSSADSRLSALPNSTVVRFDVVLDPSDPATLARLAAEVSTPGSRLYRRYVPRGRLRAEFGATQHAIDVVTAHLRSVGLSVGHISADGLSLPVAGSAGRVAEAFSIGLDRYLLPDGRVAYANTRAPLVPANVSTYVQAVVGLSTLDPPAAIEPPATTSRPRTLDSSEVITGGAEPCAAATSAAGALGAYTADQIASAYGFPGIYGLGDEGSGTTVALFELAPDLPSDIAAYEKCYDVSPAVRYLKVDGGSGMGAGQGEAALDIENVIGLAPKAKIDVYQGPDTSIGSLDTYRNIIDSDTAQVISTSWGYCETQAASVQPENTLFQMAAVQGQSVVAAAGDLGSEGCGPGGLAVDDPGSQPYVTGVGGTQLLAIDPPPLQSVWNADGAGAGGGGISAHWGMPAYQRNSPRSLGVVNGYSSGTPCGARSGSYCREVPDVSADADPSTGYLVYYHGAWRAMAGTSGAAPLWAALLALVDSFPTCHAQPIGFANPGLYRAAGTVYASDFGDITTGGNDFTNTNDGLYPALSGYDMASGLGSPVAYGLATSLCESTTPADRVMVTSPGTQISRVGSSIDLSVSGTSSGDGSLSYSAMGLPDGLSISPSGEITGVITTVGTFAVTVVATDTAGTTGSVGFDWSVVSADADIVTVANPGSITTKRGSAFELQISASDSSGDRLNFSATGLPGSLQLDPSSGEITGTITGRAGEYQVEVGATDSSGAAGSAYFMWTVTAPDHVVVTNPARRQTDKGSSVTLRLRATDSAGLDLYFVATGLPSGLTMTPAGVITGVPRTVGTHVVAVTARDAAGVSGTAKFSWRIYVLTISPASLPTARVGTHYSERLSARGGTPPYSWRVISGSLPAGLRLSPTTGVISGRAQRAGMVHFMIAVSDGAHPPLTARRIYDMVLAR